MKKQFFKIISLFLVLAIIVCGCNNNDSEVLKEIPSQTTILPVTNDGTINLTKKVTANNVSGKNADDTFINAQADFAVNLFKKTLALIKIKTFLFLPFLPRWLLLWPLTVPTVKRKKNLKGLWET